MEGFMAKQEITELVNQEHDAETSPKKRVALYGYDLPNLQWRRVSVDANGYLKVTV
jgi:uncharacterized protein (DUF736 family)